MEFNSLNNVANGITWHSGLNNPGNNSTWMYSDWNVVHVNTIGIMGDDLTVQVEAYDCALSGHGGYAYVDCFQPTEPVANPGVTVNPLNAADLDQVPEPSSFILVGVGAAALAFLRRKVSK